MPRFVVASRILRLLLAAPPRYSIRAAGQSPASRSASPSAYRASHISGAAPRASRHTLTGLSHTMLRRIVSVPHTTSKQRKARRPCQRHSAGGRRRTFDQLRDRRGHDHRHSGTRHVHAMFGHSLSERDDAGRRSDAGEPPDRAEQVERRRPSRGICRARAAPRDPAPRRIPSGSARVVTVWVWCMIA